MKWIALLAALLILPVVTAVSDVRFEVQGQPITYASPDQVVQGELSFRVSRNVLSVQWAGDALVAGGGALDTPRGCPERCRIPATLELSPQVTLTASRLIEDGNQVRLEPRDVTLNFQIDQTPPLIENIRVGECTQTCAFGPNQGNLSFTVRRQGSPVLPETVRVTANNNQLDTRCSLIQDALSCTTRISGNVDQSIRIFAEDVAGNLAEREFEVTYDAIAPSIIDVSLQADRLPINADQLPGGQSIRFLVHVEEPLAATMRVQTSFGNFTGQCMRRGTQQNQLECVADVRPPNQRITDDIEIIIADRANNQARRTLRIEVYESDATAQPNFWNVHASPRTRIDAYTWQVIPKDFFIDVRLTPIQETSGQPIIMSAQCRLAGQNLEVKPIVAQRSTRLELTLNPTTTRHQAATYEGNITCTLRTTTRVGNTVFGIGANAEEDTFEIPLAPHLVRLPPPQEQLREVQQVLNREIRDRREQLRIMSLSVEALGALCGVEQNMLAAQLVTQLVTLALDNLLGEQLATPAAEVEREVRRGIDRLRDTVQPLCFMVTCDIGSVLGGDAPEALGTNFEEGLRGHLQAIQQASGISFDRSTLLDPARSEYAAILTGCLPAYMEHQYAKLHTQCVYETCLRDAGQTGMTVRECQQQRSYAECVQQRGAFYFALPLTAWADTILARAELLLSNPLTAVGALQSAVCGMSAMRTRMLCQLDRTRNLLGNAQNTIQDFDRGYNVIRNLVSTSGDVCDVSTNFDRLLTLRQSQLPNVPTCRPGYARVTVEGNEYVVMNMRSETVIFGPSSAEMDDDARAAQRITQSSGSLQRVPPQSLPAGRYEQIQQPFQQCQEQIRSAIGETAEWAGMSWDELEEISREIVDTENLLDQERQQLERAEQGIQSPRARLIQQMDEEIDRTLGDQSREVRNAAKLEARELIRQAEREGDISPRYPCEGDPSGAAICNAQGQRFFASVNQDVSDEQVISLLERFTAQTESFIDDSEESLAEITELREQIERLENEITEQEQAIQERLDEARRQYLMQRQEFGTAEFTYEALATTYAWARTGQFLQQYGVWDAPSFGSDTINRWRQDLQADAAGILGAEKFICEVEPQITTAWQTPQGSVGARIAGYASAVEVDGATRYDIVVEVYLRAQEDVNEVARLVLRDPGVLNEHPDGGDSWEFALNTTTSRTQPGNRIVIQGHDRNYQRACLVFPQNIDQYFPVAPNQQPNRREICAQIQLA